LTRFFRQKYEFYSAILHVFCAKCVHNQCWKHC